MDDWRPKNLILILAREFASKLAVPMLIVDDTDRVVFFNEAAEELLGTTFAEAAQLDYDGWLELMGAEDLDGKPLGIREWPAALAIQAGRAVHTSMILTGHRRRRRTIDSTAFPLLGSAGPMGAVALFWERRNGNGSR
jgi:PAS domain-containing protein